MTEKSYSKVLTAVLVVVGIAIIILLGIFGFDMIKKFSNKKSAEEVVDEFNEGFGYGGRDRNDKDGNSLNIPTLDEGELGTANGNTSSGTKKKKVTYEGYNVEGTIEIPKINLKYPILERVTKESIETSVAILQPSAGPNEIGNTTIVGHNYRNGSFFGNNDRLSTGDKIYITDTGGTKIKYNIYNIYTTTPDDAEYMMRDTKGKREISLSTCTDNSKERLIIWAVEE